LQSAQSRRYVAADLITEWNIQSRGCGCEACGKPFADQEPYHTLLFDDKADFRRSDICGGCWQGQYSEGASDRKGFVSHWQGIYQAPTPPSEPIKKETAETLLRKIIELNDPQYRPAAFILAVMLERKRLLKVKEQILRDAARVFIYEQPATGDLFTIADPALRMDQLEQVQRDVAALLEYGLNPPTPQPAPTSADTAGDGDETSSETTAQPAAQPEPTAEIKTG